MSGRLYLDYCGEECVVDPRRALSFGRQGDLVIDDNPYLHRVLGVFANRRGNWILSNAGRSIVLNVSDRNGPSSAVVAPGTSVGLGISEFAVTFVAGRTRYQMEGSLEAVEAAHDTDPERQWAGRGQSTLEWGVVELNREQRQLLVDLAAPRLSDPHAPDWMPEPRAACARRLGWSLSKYNRKLDHLCEKLHRAGVPGLIGSEGAQAAQRRRVLVEHALAVGLVTPADLQESAPHPC